MTRPDRRAIGGGKRDDIVLLRRHDEHSSATRAVIHVQRLRVNGARQHRGDGRQERTDQAATPLMDSRHVTAAIDYWVCPDSIEEPANTFRPSLNVTVRALARREPSLAR
jgi:hypothetical protein